MKRILFVCVENSCRSQMAEAFTRMQGEDSIEAYSGGSRPSGTVNPRAIEMMQEVGYDMSLHKSKSFNEIPVRDYDYVIRMGCHDECPFVPAGHWEDWNIPDPKDLPDEEFREIRDLIKARVDDLIERVKV